MHFQCAVLAVALASMVSRSLGGTQTEVPLKAAGETAESEWECSLSTSTYFVQNSRDYANPTLVADREAARNEGRSLRRARLFCPGLCIVSAGGNSIPHFFTAAFRVTRLKFSFDRSTLPGRAKMGAIRWH